MAATYSFIFTTSEGVEHEYTYENINVLFEKKFAINYDLQDNNQNTIDLFEPMTSNNDNESILKNVYDIISKLSAENQTGLKVKIILRTEASDMNFDSVIFDEKLSHVNYTLRGFNNVRNEIKTTYPAVYYSNLIFSDHYID